LKYIYSVLETITAKRNLQHISGNNYIALLKVIAKVIALQNGDYLSARDQSMTSQQAMPYHRQAFQFDGNFDLMQGKGEIKYGYSSEYSTVPRKAYMQSKRNKITEKYDRIKFLIQC